MNQDPWDHVHVTTWNFMPFVLRRVGAAPKWVVDMAFAVWIAGIVALLAVLSWLRNTLKVLDSRHEIAW
jgi:apolipoprotein N-acyltransferase